MQAGGPPADCCGRVPLTANPASKGEQPMSTVDAQLLPPGTWQVDKVHSSIGFAVDYMAGTFHGTFSAFNADVADGVLNGSAKVASLQVKDENLAGHLQSPEFFDAQAHAELSFRSKTISRDGDRVRSRSRATPRPPRSRARSQIRSRTPTAASASGWRSRPWSTATSSASAGTTRCRAASRPSPTR
jgi:hypothetical protein